MICPDCPEKYDTRVVDSRDDGGTIRRRRECMKCGYRFTTKERVEVSIPMVVKRDGRRERYVRDKLIRGITTACEKRPIASNRIEDLVSDLEDGWSRRGSNEIPSEQIGQEIMAALKTLDTVAYVRFASVYLSFETGRDFLRVMLDADPKSFVQERVSSGE